MPPPNIACVPCKHTRSEISQMNKRPLIISFQEVRNSREGKNRKIGAFHRHFLAGKICWEILSSFSFRGFLCCCSFGLFFFGVVSHTPHTLSTFFLFSVSLVSV